MNNFPIGIFDSGIGGLTVVKEIIKTLPNESLIYLGDTARVPYGTRNKETITKFALELVRYLLKQKVKALVVACNTMSAVSLEEIKKVAGKIPVIDVISPTVSFAMNRTQTNVLGIIGTRATVNSGAYDTQVKKKNKAIEVLSKACPLFVPLVEEGFVNNKATELIAQKYLSVFNRTKIDTLILGCTHYPLMAEVIRKTVGRKVRLIDSAKPTAEELKKILAGKGLLSNKKPTYRFLVTDAPERVYKTANLFFDKNFPGKLEKVRI